MYKIIYVFFIGVLIRTFEISVISVINFLIRCLVSEIVKDKVPRHPPSWIFKKSMTSQPGKLTFLLKKQLTSKSNVEIQLTFWVNTSYVN